MLTEKTDLTIWLLNIHAGKFDKDWQNSCENIASLSRIWNDTVAMGEYIGEPEPVLCIMKLRHVSQLTKLHDTWAQRVSNKKEAFAFLKFQQKYGTTCFPKPPLKGTDTIVPIETVQELFAEGRIMHNCVASYAHRVMDGECYIYRVLEPERATLEISDESGRFLPVQIKAVCNSEAGEKTKSAVLRWIESAKPNKQERV
jgi:hypothetical protein